MTNVNAEAAIEASATLPSLTLTRDFRATPAQLHRAHTDPELYARWVGPSDIAT
ncbi:SRPBCC family protein, partial [Mycobacterium kansasii]